MIAISELSKPLAKVLFWVNEGDAEESSINACIDQFDVARVNAEKAQTINTKTGVETHPRGALQSAVKQTKAELVFVALSRFWTESTGQMLANDMAANLAYIDVCMDELLRVNASGAKVVVIGFPTAGLFMATTQEAQLTNSEVVAINKVLQRKCVDAGIAFINLDWQMVDGETDTENAQESNKKSYLELLRAAVVPYLTAFEKPSIKDYLLQHIPTWLFLRLKWNDFKKNKPKAFERIQQNRVKVTTSEGSYKPFDEKQAIFVHVPKCAGISVNKALFGNLAGGHTTLDEYLNVFEPHLIERYFKFTIVRNPWDRIVSAYHFLQQGGMNDWDRDFYQQELACFDDFNDFVLYWLTQPHNLYKHHHFKPQVHYIKDKYNQVQLDFIGRVENMAEDFAYVCQKLGVENTLTVANKSNRSNYRDYYNEQSKAIVASVYKDDIDYLNYEF